MTETRSNPRSLAPVLVAGAIALALLIAGLLASLALGAVSFPIGEVIRALLDRTQDGAARNIVWNLRLPRALLGAIVGMNLAVAGVLLQGVMRNPVAAPNIVGVTAGGGLGATIIIVAFPSAVAGVAPAAFAGAVIAGLIVFVISWQPGIGTSPVRMVLAGVAVTAILTAVTTFLMVTFSERVQAVVLWMSGSLVGRSWNEVVGVWTYALVGVLGALLLAKPLDTLQLGDDVARSLGQRVDTIRFTSIAIAALLAGSAVSVAGMIGFVGLIVPHIARMIVGSRHVPLVVVSMIGGAALVVWSDLAGRLIIAPSEMPAGVITALIGGPYFIFLLYKTRMLR
ncbi:MAG: iron ABC transporter permease [Planctomycetota bacterium]